MPKFKVITLCGSTKFKDEFIKQQKRLTLEGNIVISLGLFGHSGDSEVWEGQKEGTSTKTHQMFEEMHKQRIDMADEIFVINVNGYIGEGLRNEIQYAIENNKKINFLEPIKELNLCELLNNTYNNLLINGRDATIEERQSVQNYVESISESTGYNFLKDEYYPNCKDQDKELSITFSANVIDNELINERAEVLKDKLKDFMNEEDQYENCNKRGYYED